MFIPICEKCEKPLEEPGALIFSPPVHANVTVIKTHICTLCYVDVINFIGGK